jgi:MFS transporter, PAT family, beta-lactamase induction signal transducer AmpG
MLEHASPKNDWRSSIALLFSRNVITMLFLGFSAGIPLLLIFSSLSLWLREAGIDRATVTYFSWAALAYSFKFLWAPLIDRVPIPLLTARFGRRRAWLLLSQCCIAGAIFLMASIDPQQTASLTRMAVAVVLLGFAAATQDIVIDAFRIESAPQDAQAMMSSTYIAGYRVGMLFSGAGALLLANYLGSASDNYVYAAWSWTYRFMAGSMAVGIITTLLASEPVLKKSSATQYRVSQYARFVLLFLINAAAFVLSYFALSTIAAASKIALADFTAYATLANFSVEILRLACGIITVACVSKLLSFTPLYEKQLVHDTYIAPVLDFFQRFGNYLACLLLVFIGFYRISDIVRGIISNVFFQDMVLAKPK